MSPATAGFIGIVVLVALFLLRMPVAFAMALVGIVGFAYLTGPEAALNLLGIDIFDQFSSYPLSVIPMFILMGSFAFASGISRRLYQDGLCLDRAPPGRPDGSHRICLCRVRRYLRVEHGDGSHNGKNCASGDEEV